MVGPKLQTKDPIAAEDYGCHCLPSTWTEMITEKVMKFAEPNDPNAANIKSNIMKPAKLHGGCRKFAHHHLKMIKQWLNQTYLKKWEGRCWTSTCLTCFFGVWKCSLKRFGLGLKMRYPKIRQITIIVSTVLSTDNCFFELAISDFVQATHIKNTAMYGHKPLNILWTLWFHGLFNQFNQWKMVTWWVLTEIPRKKNIGVKETRLGTTMVSKIAWTMISLIFKAITCRWFPMFHGQEKP